MEQNLDDEIHVVSYDVNKEAPFTFGKVARLTNYPRKDLNIEDIWAIVDRVKPGVIFCSGWIDKQYLGVIRLARHKTPCFLIVDNPWLGTFKQKLLAPYGRLFFPRLFSGAWVPGRSQAEFMKRLGFKQGTIYEGFYSTNTAIFEKKYEDSKMDKESSYPKVIACAARYIPQKGLENLWDNFITVIESNPEMGDWKLWMFGHGVNYNDRKQHPNIIHHGFVQPQELMNYLPDIGIFVLPSKLEPWGMVVHEFAAGGIPLLLSNKVFSGDKFLENEKNGFTFDAEAPKDLRQKLKAIMQLSSPELNAMSQASFELAKTEGADKWSATMQSIYNTFVK